MKRFLFLIGMPGCGKSTWGREVSKAFNLPFIDLDEYIEQTEGSTISHILQNKGEETFRDLEIKALNSLITNISEFIVVSCGGGTPLRPINMAAMKQHGVVIYLKAPLDMLTSNIDNDLLKNRPLLYGKADLMLTLDDIYQQRKGVYEQAHHIFDIRKLSIADFQPILKQCIEQD
mgnify:FL=1